MVPRPAAEAQSGQQGRLAGRLKAAAAVLVDAPRGRCLMALVPSGGAWLVHRQAASARNWVSRI